MICFVSRLRSFRQVNGLYLWSFQTALARFIAPIGCAPIIQFLSARHLRCPKLRLAILVSQYQDPDHILTQANAPSRAKFVFRDACEIFNFWIWEFKLERRYELSFSLAACLRSGEHRRLANCRHLFIKTRYRWRSALQTRLYRNLSRVMIVQAPRH